MMRHRTVQTSRSQRSALLIIDMINRFEFPGGERLARSAERIAPAILRLRGFHRNRGWPVVYCNDNFGRWRSDFRKVVEACSESGSGSRIAEWLHPETGDYFILKPKHSAFYSTALDLLLRSLRIGRLVLSGVAGDGCVQATAIDAHMRDYEVCVASDATASLTTSRNRKCLETLASNGTARTLLTATLVRN